MQNPILLLALLCLCMPAKAQEVPTSLSVELNAQQTLKGGCLLSFMVNNGHSDDIDGAIFETVLFNQAGQVDRLTLFDFGSLPAGRSRVRQFQVDGLGCDDLGQILINGPSTCKIAGTDSTACDAPKLGTRTGTELIG